ncbi:MAG: hypothetical protein ABR961_02195 [Thermoanaerobaculaceae bacterium]
MGMLSPAARRRLIGTAIVVFWVAMMGVQVHREFGGRGIIVRHPARVVLPHPGESWLGVLIGRPASRHRAPRDPTGGSRRARRFHAAP